MSMIFQNMFTICSRFAKKYAEVIPKICPSIIPLGRPLLLPVGSKVHFVGLYQFDKHRVNYSHHNYLLTFISWPNKTFIFCSLVMDDGKCSISKLVVGVGGIII